MNEGLVHLKLVHAGFPRLEEDPYQITSDENPTYNCVAWAAGDTARWWAPRKRDLSYFWPAWAPEEETTAACVRLFEGLGFQVCRHDSFEQGYEKVAIFERDGEAKHVARQLPGGRWTSKIGIFVDITHDLRSLEGRQYGSVRVILRRPRVRSARRAT